MNVLSGMIHLLAKSFRALGTTFFKFGGLLEGLLTALLSPRQLTNHLNGYYASTYYSKEWEKDQLPEESHHAFLLEPWETEVVNKYHLNSGNILVLGAGWGREAIALAKGQASVIGIDRIPTITQAAQKFSRSIQASARFLVADFFALPFAHGQFDSAFLTCTMYSAIPSTQNRQTWLKEVGRCLKPQGLIILSFHIKHPHQSRGDRLIERLNAWIRKFPGANTTHQPGDKCHGGHFFHMFQDESELRQEFQKTGLVIQEVNWGSHFAILSRPPLPVSDAHPTQLSSSVNY